GNFPNVVSMSRNMLPFEKEERERYTDIKSKIRFRILKKTQSHTFHNSKGVIFLSEYAKNYIVNLIKLTNEHIIIPHGINVKFLNEPKIQYDVNEYTSQKPFKFLYVSKISVYKHHWNVAEAVIRL